MVLERIVSLHAQRQNQQTWRLLWAGCCDLGTAKASLSCFHPPEVPFAQVPEITPAGVWSHWGYLVSGLKAFHLPAYVLHQLWVEELWAALVIWLKEGECDPNSCCSRLGVLMLLCSPNLLLPGFLQKCRIQRTW